MAWKFGKKSLERLAGVKEPLQTLAKSAITYSPFDFSITCGLRTIEEQRVLFANGKSKTMKSKHITGDAFDIAVFDEHGKLTWDLKYYKKVAEHIKREANKLGIKITWGGDWQWIDGPHFQLEK